LNKPLALSFILKPEMLFLKHYYLVRYWNLIDVICSIACIDFIEQQQQRIKDNKAAVAFLRMLPQNVLNRTI
jgi:hypothetical protein